MARGGRDGSAQSAERVQKILASLGLGSRREAEDWIRAGRVTINGRRADLGARASPQDRIHLDGRLVRQRAVESPSVFLCHRSPGEDLASLIARLPRRAGRRFVAVSPMPRIDGALEIVTGDGNLAARLQRNVHALPSEFSARVRGELTEAQLDAIREGPLPSVGLPPAAFRLSPGRRTRSERPGGSGPIIERIEPSGGEGANRWYAIVARRGSGKDIRQLLESQGALVSRVLRTRVGPVTLDRNLPRGRFRALTPEELEGLLTVEAAAGDAAARGAE